MASNERGSIYVLQLTLPSLKLSVSLLAQSSYPPTCSLVCITHAAAIEMAARRWLAHLCGRAGARRPAIRHDRRSRGG
eukprot:3525227-Pyramimonas_sp.AAC.1